MNPKVFSHYTSDKQWNDQLKPIYEVIEWVISYQIQYASYIVKALQLVFTLVGGGQTDQSTLPFMQRANDYLYRQDICINWQYLICMYLIMQGYICRPNTDKQNNRNRRFWGGFCSKVLQLLSLIGSISVIFVCTLSL